MPEVFIAIIQHLSAIDTPQMIWFIYLQVFSPSPEGSGASGIGAFFLGAGGPVFSVFLPVLGASPPAHPVNQRNTFKQVLQIQITDGIHRNQINLRVPTEKETQYNQNKYNRSQ